MSYPLPRPGTKAREMMGDLAHIVEVLAPENAAKLPYVWQAASMARKAFEADTTKAMRRITYVIVRADSNQKWLVSFGRRGGWQKEWNFGTGAPV